MQAEYTSTASITLMTPAVKMGHCSWRDANGSEQQLNMQGCYTQSPNEHLNPDSIWAM
jgi:hypothetical protein